MKETINDAKKNLATLIENSKVDEKKGEIKSKNIDKNLN